MTTRSATTPRPIDRFSPRWRGIHHLRSLLLVDPRGNLREPVLHACRADRSAENSWTPTLPTIWDRLTRRASARATTSPTSRSCGSGERSTSRFRDVRAVPRRRRGGTLPASRSSIRASSTSGPAPRERSPARRHPRRRRIPRRGLRRARFGSDWDSTVLIVTYDEWGGFFDHVPASCAARTRSTPTSSGARRSRVSGSGLVASRYAGNPNPR